MEDRQRGMTIGVRAEEAVPEGAAAHCGNLETARGNLAMQFVQTIDRDMGQRLRVDLRASVGGGFDARGEASAVTLHLAGGGIEQQRTDRRTADFETYNE